MRQVAGQMLFAAALALAVSCGSQRSQDIPSSSRGTPDETFIDFMTQESDSGRIRWKLTAPNASKYTSKGLVVLEAPTIRFFDEQGLLQTTLTSDRGELYQESQDMLAYGNVVVVSENGDVLEADSLYWIDAEGKITSNTFVKLKRGDDILTGYGLDCDYNLSSVNIRKNVEARIVEREGSVNE
ncbi:MAG: LPS export ABC transporter periplasmic protein LptC [Chitinivibrionia bacterium]|nr:LPS export ABC transporter periplasmic protein LptC [Chitinivibrionia bacterium]